jgi:hypothetical protein
VARNSAQVRSDVIDFILAQRLTEWRHRDVATKSVGDHIADRRFIQAGNNIAQYDFAKWRSLSLSPVTIDAIRLINAFASGGACSGLTIPG